MSDKYLTADQLEDYIQDWHWNKKSHEIAKKMGLFIFEFINQMHDKGTSERTLRKHESNCQLIGKFIADYGYFDDFSLAMFEGEPGYLREFKRKVSDSKYMIDSFKTTWRKLSNYVKSQK